MRTPTIAVLVGTLAAGVLALPGVANASTQTADDPAEPLATCKTKVTGHNATGQSRCTGFGKIDRQRVRIKCGDGRTIHGPWVGNKEWSMATCKPPHGIEGGPWVITDDW